MIDLNLFPEPLRRLVWTWEYWEQVAVSARRARAEAIARTGRQVPAPTMPTGPRMSPTGDFGLFTPQMVFILTQSPNGYRVDVQDRGVRSVWGEFSDFWDVEKFLLWRFGDMVRREYGLRPLSAVFYESGWQGGVRWEMVDRQAQAELETGFGPQTPRLVRLFLEDDPQPRAVLGVAAAMPFSHVLQLSFDDLHQHLHARIPVQALPAGSGGAIPASTDGAAPEGTPAG